MFDDLLAEWKEKGFAPLRERWLANAKNLGKEINVHMEHEDKKGIFNGVDENGALLLETPVRHRENICRRHILFEGKRS